MSLLRAGLAPFPLARRRLRSDPLFAAALFVATAATAFLFALVPQLFDRKAASSLEHTVTRASPRERDVAITSVGQIPAAAGEDPFRSVAATGATHEQAFPASVRDVIGARRVSVETVRHTLVTPPGERGLAGTTRYLTLRYLDDAAGHVDAVEGALPTGRAGPVELPFGDGGAATGLEIALARTTARQLSVRLGDRLFATPAEDDPLVRGVARSDRRYLALEVVGILEGTDGAWIRDSRLGRATVRDTESRRFVSGSALLSREAYNALVAGVDPTPLRYEWRYVVDPAAVGRSDVERLAADVRQVESAFGQEARTGLARILERYVTGRQAAAAVLAVAGIALLSVALVVLGVLAGLAAGRREEAIVLLRSRGASLTQTLATLVVEGLLVAVPAGVLGYAAATLAAARPPALLPALLVAVVVLGAAALLAAVAVGPARRALVVRDRDPSAAARRSPERLAFELLVVVGSLGGAYLLRRRGLDPEGGFDPFLAAVPVLVGLGAGLLALRLYPLPLRALAWAVAPRSDLVPALGLRRLAREPSLAAAPLLVVLLATSVGVFVATLATTIASAQDGVAAALLTPLDTFTRTVFTAGVAIAGAYAAIALVLAPVLTGRARRRDFAYLRALGLSRRDVLRLAALELAPPVAAGLVLGTLLGFALAYLVEPGLDLAALAGGEDVALEPALLAPVLLAVGLTLVTAAATLLAGAAARRISISRVLRTGER